MGKMFNTLVLSGIASIVLLLFDGNGAIGVIGQMFLAPQTSWGAFLMDALTSGLGLATGVGVSAIIIGSVVIKQDWLLRLGMFTVLTSWVEAPLISLWQFLGSKIIPLEECTNSFTCYQLVNQGVTTGGMLIAGLIMGPIILYGLWACWSQIWSPESTG